MSSSVESYEKRRERVKAELLQRQSAEKNVLSVIMSLLEGGVTERQLIESASKLTPSHYKDVTEERGLALLCGYPLCPNKLKPLNYKQKYHISARSNKVYDISERKYFCSSDCYKASKYLEGQLSEEPVWGRFGTADIQLQTKEGESKKAAAVNDESVIIDRHTAHIDNTDITEVLAADILQKLTVADSEEIQQYPNEQSGEEGSDGEDSEEEDISETINSLLDKRRNQRLSCKPPDPKPAADVAAEEDWQGSMLNRLRTSANSDDVTPSSANNSDPNTSLANNSSSTNALTKQSTNRSDSNKLKHISAYKDRQKQPPLAKTVLLDCTMPAPKVQRPHTDVAVGESSQHRSLKACLDRLTQWFTADSRKLLFLPITESAAADHPSTAAATTAAAEEQAAGSADPGSSSADAEVEISAPCVQTISSQQRSIVYHRILKCYGRLMHSLPEHINLKDRVGALVKTLRLDKDNIAAKSLEWNTISLVLAICMCGDAADTTQGAADELVRLTGDVGSPQTIQEFIRQQKQLLTS